MRGKVAFSSSDSAFIRITPAYAGKSRPDRGAGTPYRDHPRVCGEKFTKTLDKANRKGSPPRMRGKGQCTTMATTRHRDHPRVCGEKTFLCHAVQCPLGSPPRMRGKEFQIVGHAYRPGITPAYAGKSTCAPSLRERRQDHPRVCGEKITSSI